MTEQKSFSLFNILRGRERADIIPFLSAILYVPPPVPQTILEALSCPQDERCQMFIGNNVILPQINPKVKNLSPAFSIVDATSFLVLVRVKLPNNCYVLVPTRIAVNNDVLSVGFYPTKNNPLKAIPGFSEERDSSLVSNCPSMMSYIHNIISLSEGKSKMSD